ncbi:hypothetical protein, conserved [Eimeria tenella]|uniref:Uncharacterized protein n=1 Tax=Eimeria tenella TaxID=5802 RepID=U6KT86_EIMTE|nr:hypothetical protein, conserved [Eimeria tenella]CDJ41176.1 hypothetical protein, conserved [Eimeria tenella]|eukprot:XP_013231926.1 hypothetical protein, conserved [Eimeria tenella]
MQPSGCGSHGGYYPPPSLAYTQPHGFNSTAQQTSHDPQSGPSVQTCVRDSVRLLGEAVAVLEGVRLLGSQLLQWGGELSHVAQSVVPAALILQMCRWMYTRTFGASKRQTLSRMHKAWLEASGDPRLMLPTSNGSSSIGGLLGAKANGKRRGSWISTLRDLSALMALIVVAAELYIHFSVYRRLVSRLRVLTAKERGLAGPSAEASSSNGSSTSFVCKS